MLASCQQTVLRGKQEIKNPEPNTWVQKQRLEG